VPGDGWLLVEPRDHLGVTIGHLSNGFVGEDLRVCVCLLDGLRVVGPARCDRGVGGLLEQVRPAVPAARQKPESVDEDDRRSTCRVGLLNLASRAAFEGAAV
jgi:hypothetical protein